MWSLVQELAAYPGYSIARRSFDRADELLAHQRQRLRSGPAKGRATTDPDFLSALDRYIQGFRATGSRILRMIDTCEELAKAHPDNVEETFLCALRGGPQTRLEEAPDPRRGVAGLRVIFAGRRLLAPSGYRWRAPDAAALAHLATRPFLRLMRNSRLSRPGSGDVSG